MNNLAIIPARGGSKRIPRKNIKDFLGKPIIAYSIETALESDLFDEVMVSTDDKEIAEIALSYGAKVPFYRNPETANDFAPTLAVIQEVIATYRLQLGKNFDYICCIYPTAPLINNTLLQVTLELLKSKKYDSAFPVTAFSYPIWRGLERANDGKTGMIWPEHLNSRSQDLKTVYHDAGQLYWLNPQQINDTLFTNNTGTIVLGETEVQDIDNLTDWKLAEIKYKLLHET